MAADFELTIANTSEESLMIGSYRLRAGASVVVNRTRLLMPGQKRGQVAIPEGEDPQERTLSDIVDALTAERINVTAGGKSANTRMVRTFFSGSEGSPFQSENETFSAYEGIENILVENTGELPFVGALPDPRDHEGKSISIQNTGKTRVLIGSLGGANGGLREPSGTISVRPGRQLRLTARTTDAAVPSAIWEVTVDSDGGDVQLVEENTADISVWSSIVLVDQTADSAVTLALPEGEAHWSKLVLIKDRKGTGATRNITINRAGSDTIDGATSKVISTNYGYARLLWYGGEWNQIG